MKPVRLNIGISRSLRHQLQERLEADRGVHAELRTRPMGELVEELLRFALNARASENFILLKVDNGLWEWLNAHVAGIGLAGGLEETAIYMIRTQMLADMESPPFRAAMCANLPPEHPLYKPRTA